MQFMRAHLHDPGWFQSGSYNVFHRHAQSILEGRERVFWIDDPSRTDLVQYPPAFPWWVAIIYKFGNDHSAYAVLRVQWLLDLVLTMLLASGIAWTAYGWRASVGTSFLVGLSPLLAMYGASPTADAPTTWFVLGGLWCLLLTVKRNSMRWAIGAGVLLGVACWLRVNPLYLSVFWAIALFIFARMQWRRKLVLSAAVALSTVIVISPIIVRNYLVFPDFTPTGGTLGTNLWEGLGETELGRKHGFLLGDHLMVERERIKLGLPADYPITVMWPDGIRRERERTRESLEFIKQHPIWYAGVMFHRMWGMLKVAGAPLPYYGSAGINVTSKKVLPPERQGGVLALFVNLLGMVQSVTRYLLLPLAAFGIWLGVRRNWLMASLLLATMFYYLVPGSAAHTEIRYVLPLHCILPVFAGLSLSYLAGLIFRRDRSAVGRN
ncbi:MAG TPA: glycosyltransferase family 39 protein [Pyrinomonadaceae bacterium]|nr:glycosyltransferase family 39 protein [Pyrinomonadaceae bacterium]